MVTFSKQVNINKKFNFNGQEFNSIDEMPEDIKMHFKDEDNNGRPDFADDMINKAQEMKAKFENQKDKKQKINEVNEPAGVLKQDYITNKSKPNNNWLNWILISMVISLIIYIIINKI